MVLGTRPRRPDELDDLGLIGCTFRRRGELVGTAAGAAALGHPAAAVVWLVDALAARGQTLPAGSLVLTGGLTRPVPLVLTDVVIELQEGDKLRLMSPLLRKLAQKTPRS